MTYLNRKTGIGNVFNRQIASVYGKNKIYTNLWLRENEEF